MLARLFNQKMGIPHHIERGHKIPSGICASDFQVIFLPPQG